MVDKVKRNKAAGKPLADASVQSSRRDMLIRATGLVAGAGLVASCGSAQDDKPEAPAVIGKKRKLTMVTSWPKNFPGLGTGAARVAKRIEALSDGRITIKVYAAGEVVGALGIFDAVAQGQADMYHGADYYFQGKSPAFNFFAAVPMGLTANEHFAWIKFMGGQDLWDELSGTYGVKPFMAGSSGTQMGGWFAKDIKSLDDFKGLRIRMPGLGGEVFRRLGASPVTMAGGDIFQALSQGNLDATEWVGPWNDLNFGFHTVIKNYFYPGIHEPGTILSCGLNKALWEDMSAQEKAIIEAATDAENTVMLAEFNARNAEALDVLIGKHEVQLKRFDDAILKALANVSAKVLADAAKTDDITARVFESFSKARTRGIRWGQISERAFANARDLEG